jgi:CSLREA domain-containing protein
MLALITVNSLLDNGDGVKTTLREAIQTANFNPDHDTIEFSTNPSDGLNGGAITLTQGQLNISQAVTINASMLAAGLTVDASGNDPTPNQNEGNGSRIFKISLSPGSLGVEINSLTLTGGDLPSGSDPSGGGAIACEAATVTLKNCMIKENASVSHGGGIFAPFALAV